MDTIILHWYLHFFKFHVIHSIYCHLLYLVGIWNCIDFFKIWRNGIRFISNLLKTTVSSTTIYNNNWLNYNFFSFPKKSIKL
jgi:hypothetical protein